MMQVKKHKRVRKNGVTVVKQHYRAYPSDVKRRDYEKHTVSSGATKVLVALRKRAQGGVYKNRIKRADPARLKKRAAKSNKIHAKRISKK